jgi:hypothetical protein
VPGAWYGRDLASRTSEWVHELSGAEVAELEAAVDALFACGLARVDGDELRFAVRVFVCACVCANMEERASWLDHNTPPTPHQKNSAR